MRNKNIIWIIALCFLVFNSALVMSAYVEKQRYTGTGANNDFGMIPSNPYKASHSFTANSSYNIDLITISVSCQASGTYPCGSTAGVYAGIWSANSSGFPVTLIANATSNNSGYYMNGTPVPNYINFTFPSVPITDGVTYAIVIDSNKSSNTDYFVWSRSPSGSLVATNFKTSWGLLDASSTPYLITYETPTIAPTFLILSALNINNNASADICAFKLYNASNSYAYNSTNGTGYFSNLTGLYTANVSCLSFYPSSSSINLSSGFTASNVYLYPDNTSPSITGIYPNNIAIARSGNIITNINATDDLGLFSLKAWVYFPNGSLMNVTNVTNISGLPVSYNLANTLDISTMPNGNYTFNGTICDGHTAQILSANLTAKLNPKSLELKNEQTRINLSIVSANNSVSFSDVIYKADRVAYSISKDIPDGKTIDNEIKFNIKSDSPIYYINNKKYLGWFVTGNNWIDFEGAKSIKSVSCKNSYSCDIVVVGDSDNITFNSVGELNCVNFQKWFYLYSTNAPACIAPSGYTPYGNQPIVFNLSRYNDTFNPAINYSVNAYFHPTLTLYGYIANLNDTQFINNGVGSVTYNNYPSAFIDLNNNSQYISFGLNMTDTGTLANLAKTTQAHIIGVVVGKADGQTASPVYCGGVSYMCPFAPNISFASPSNNSIVSNGSVIIVANSNMAICPLSSSITNYTFTLSYANGSFIENDFFATASASVSNEFNLTEYGNYSVNVRTFSIQGIENNISLNVQYQNVTAPSQELNPNQCPSTTEAISIFTLVLALGGFLTWLGFSQRFGLLGIIGGLIFIACGAILLDCYDFIGFLSIVAGISIMFVSIFAVRIIK